MKEDQAVEFGARAEDTYRTYARCWRRFPSRKPLYTIPASELTTEAAPKMLLPHQGSSFHNHRTITCRQQHFLYSTKLNWVLSDLPNYAQQTPFWLSCILLHATNIQLKLAQILGDDGTGFASSHRQHSWWTPHKCARKGKSRIYYFQTLKLQVDFLGKPSIYCSALSCFLIILLFSPVKVYSVLSKKQHCQEYLHLHSVGSRFTPKMLLTEMWKVTVLPRRQNGW